MTLYLKYRPQKIADLDITSVRERLTELVNTDSMPQAFLFAGSKGTGKTSSARILAKAINCEKNDGHGEPCNECDTCRAITAGNHIDVIEMDAASNRGIDDVRSLREQVHLGPVLARKKVYIIDEAHMLTTEAANALLKTLEEPPSHAVFVLATTDPQKLPSTVISRLTVIEFPRATIEEIAGKLKSIAKSEKIEVTDEVLLSIARSADGAFRDAVKTLEQLSREGSLDKGDTHFLWSTAPLKIVDLVAKGETTAALSILTELVSQGASLKLVMAQTIKHIHELLLGQFGLSEVKGSMSTESLLLLLDILIEASRKVAYADPAIVFSSALIKFSQSSSPSAATQIEVTAPVVSRAAPAAPAITKEAVKDETVIATDTPEVQKKNTDTVVVVGSTVSTEAWTKLLAAIKIRNASIEALLRAAHPIKIDGENLAIGVYYRFHKERLEVGPHRLACEEAAESVFGRAVRVSYELTDRPVTEPTVPSEPSLTPVASADIINAAAEIFSV
jgi:DNA polymerase-3 subunit gamma/tau